MPEKDRMQQARPQDLPGCVAADFQASSGVAIKIQERPDADGARQWLASPVRGGEGVLWREEGGALSVDYGTFRADGVPVQLRRRWTTTKNAADSWRVATAEEMRKAEQRLQSLDVAKKQLVYKGATTSEDVVKLKDELDRLRLKQKRLKKLMHAEDSDDSDEVIDVDSRHHDEDRFEHNQNKLENMNTREKEIIRHILQARRQRRRPPASQEEKQPQLLLAPPPPSPPARQEEEKQPQPQPQPLLAPPPPPEKQGRP